MSKTHQIAVLAGDGIGPEVVREGLRVLDAVGREVLRRRHHVVMLNAARQRRPHFPQQEGILAVGFLGAPPGRMPQKIDADPAEEIAAVGAKFTPDGVPYPAFEIDVEARAPGHGDREAGGVSLGDTPGPVAEEQVGNAEALVPCSDGVENFAVATAFDPLVGQEAMARAHEDLLVEGEFLEAGIDSCLSLCDLEFSVLFHQLSRRSVLASGLLGGA